MNLIAYRLKNNQFFYCREVDFQIAYAAVCKILNSEVCPNAFFAVSDIFAAAIIRSAYRYGLAGDYLWHQVCLYATFYGG